MTTSPSSFQVIPIGELALSKTNPRQHFDQKGLEELTASVKAKGVLVPLLVRPATSSAGSPCNGGFEIVAGARRFRAAQAAELTELPCLVRTLSDLEVLEAQVIENLQREDVQPLDEAQGYQTLMVKHKYDVSRIAERVGRSVKYVYDRVKLLALTKECKELFWAEKITAGHAILLARLKAADQKRCVESLGGLFTGEQLLWDPHGALDEEEPMKPRSVRELQAWIDEHVKFDLKAADPMLFPETVSEVVAAQSQLEKIVPITYDHYVQRDARDGQRVFGPRSWKRADGKHGSKACDYAVTGVVVVGPERGKAFKVCIEKKKCKPHYGQEMRESAKRASGTKEQASAEKLQKHYERERAQREAERERWKHATPAILKAVGERVKKMPARANGWLAKVILDEILPYPSASKQMSKYVPNGTTAEDLVRHVGFAVLFSEVDDDWNGPRSFPKRAKALGLDLAKILDQAAPVKAEPLQTSAKGKNKKFA